MIKALILSRESIWDGGVVNFIESMKKNFPMNISVVSFNIGRRRNSGSGNRLYTPVQDAYRLYKRVRSYSYDVVHLNPSLNKTSLLRDGLFMLVLRFCGCKAVFVTWHGWDVNLANQLQSWPLKMLFQASFGYAHSLWVLASSFGAQLAALGIETNKIKQFTTMFDGSIFQGVMRNRNDNKVRFLFLSRFERTKGIYELLEAFHAIKQQFENIELVFAGDGPEMKAMSDWVKDHNHENSISFTGYLRDGDKVQALLDADIFVFPTYYGEGCPVSLLEAMAAGLPIITAPAGGIPDIFHDEVHGYLLSKVTPETIKEALVKLLEDNDEMVRFGKHNRIEAWEKYEAKVITQKLEKQYFEIAGDSEDLL